MKRENRVLADRIKKADQTKKNDVFFDGIDSVDQEAKSFPCLTGKISNSMTKYKLDHTKVMTPPIVDRSYYQSPVNISVVNPLNPQGQEYELRTVDLTRVNYEVIGFEPVNKRKQACQDFVANTAVSTSSQCLFPCGDIWEHYQYFDESGRPFQMAYGYTTEKPPKDEGMSFLVSQLAQEEIDCLDEGERPEFQTLDVDVDAKKEERKRYLRKIKKTVRRLINANRLTYMYTLTFALELNENVHGLRFVLPEEKQKNRLEVFKMWNKRLTFIRRKLKECYDREFRFVLVPEIHDGETTDERKQGTYHLHLATEKPLNKQELQKLWGLGIVWIDNFSKEKTYNQDTGKYETHDRDFLNDPGRYMAKYLDKELESEEEDFEMWRKHKYSSSRNLKRPEKLKIRDEKAIEKALTNPETVFDFEGVSKVQAAKIRVLKDVNEIKTFSETYEIEFKKWEGGEKKTVKMLVNYTCYNFRLLLPGAKRLKTKQTCQQKAREKINESRKVSKKMGH